jgi:endo-1,4-beta-xylanase
MKVTLRLHKTAPIIAGLLLAIGALMAQPADLLRVSQGRSRDGAKAAPASASQSPAPENTASRAAAKPQSTPTLRSVADTFGFHIGAIMQPKMFDDPLYRDGLSSQFNVFTSFVFMKQVEPVEGHYNFSGMDRDMQFARDHQQKLFGAAPIYRAGVVAPDWLVPQRFGNFGRPAADFDRIMKDYIETTLRHGGDSYYAWEVVDEPLSNKNQPWESVFGRDEYISKAFRYARAANSNTVLELNETFGQAGIDRAKCDQFFDLIERLKARGVPIDAAGTEMHIEAQQLRPTYLDELKYFLDRARATKVQAFITEMDVYQGPPGAFADPMERQKQIYHDMTATCLADSNCTTLIFFGVSDIRTWLRAKVREPRADAQPLLFDEMFQPKPAYYGVLQALEEHAATLKSAGRKHGGK